MTRTLTLLLAAIFALPVFAQADLTATYTQPDAFEIDYPAGWQVVPEESTGFVYLRHDDLELTLYSPTTLAAYGLDNYNPAALTGLILDLNAVTGGDSQTLEIAGRETAIRRYTNPDTGDAGLLIAHPFKDGAVGLIDAHGPPGSLAENENLILQMAAAFDLPPVPAPTTLANQAAPWPQAIADLESSGLIPSGGELVFAERYVYAAGTNLTQPLAQSLSLANVVMAGSLTYTPSANPVNESCGLIARRIDDSTRLEVGIDSHGSLYLSEAAGSTESLHDGLDPTATHRILIAALDNRLLVYLDGERVADRKIAAGAGHFGIRVQGDGPGATCEATDLWVYRVPGGVASGTCNVTADGGAVNKRSGPGTTFDIAGILDDGAISPAIAQSTGSDGLAWWQLRDSSWVREDVVSESGTCRALPAPAP